MTMALMFYADRSVYSALTDPATSDTRGFAANAQAVVAAGGRPYLVSVSDRPYAYPLVLDGQTADAEGRPVHYRVFNVTDPATRTLASLK
jgi:hypothetical protein